MSGARKRQKGRNYGEGRQRCEYGWNTAKEQPNPSGSQQSHSGEERYPVKFHALVWTSRMSHPIKLFAGEALEVGHLALHLFAGGVGGGADALGAELEFVGVGGARQSFVEGDELFGIEIEERLIEGLHTVLAGAGGDGVMDEARLVRINDAITDVRGGDHDFAGGDAAFVVGAPD